MSLRSFNHAFGESNYHIVLVPKDRRNIFKNIHAARGCKLVFQEFAEQYGYRILALEVMEDHVHLLLEMHPHILYHVHFNCSWESQLGNFSGDSRV